MRMNVVANVLSWVPKCSNTIGPAKFEMLVKERLFLLTGA